MCNTVRNVIQSLRDMPEAKMIVIYITRKPKYFILSAVADVRNFHIPGGGVYISFKT